MASKRDSLIASAEKSVQKGKIDSALKDYLKVLEETPADINILNKVGDLYVRLNKNEESLPFFIKIAEHYSRDGFFLKAIAIYKRINKIDPSRLEVYERLAELYSKQGLGMEAKSQYQVLADYFTKQGNITSALGIYQKMVQSEPSNIQLHVKLADLFTQARRVPDALNEYGIVAGMLRDRGAFEESIQVYDKALKIAPDNVEILKTYIPLLVGAGRNDEARNILRKALETTPRSVPLFLLAADAALSVNDMAEARTYATKAQAVDPENEDVLSTVVRIQLKGRRPDLAFSAAAPLADQAVRRGESKKALALLIPIAKAAPDNEDVLRKIVDISRASGDEHASIPYQSALAEIWFRQGMVAEAADALRVLTRLAPDVADFRARLAQLEPALPAGGVPVRAAQPGEREITLSGVLPTPRKTAPEEGGVVPQTPASPGKQPAVPAPDTFEFELLDDELVLDSQGVAEPTPLSSGQFAGFEAAPSAQSFERAPTGPEPHSQPVPSRPPPLSLPVPEADETDPGLPGRGSKPSPKREEEKAPVVSFETDPSSWESFSSGSASAAEAMEEFEAREAESAARNASEATRLPVSNEYETPEISEVVEIEEAEEVLEAADGLDIEEVSPSLSPAPSAPSFDESFSSDFVPPMPGREAIGSFELPENADDLGFVSMAGAPLEALVPEAEPKIATVSATPQVVVPKSSGPDAEETLVEAEVFRKYGLLDKAIDQLKSFSKLQPEVLKVRERLLDLYLEQGKKNAARREAEFLRPRYLEQGLDERVKAIDALLGVATDAPVPPPSALPDAGLLPRSGPSGTFKRVSAEDIKLPIESIAARQKSRAVEPPPLPPSPPPLSVPPASIDSFPLEDLGAIDLSEIEDRPPEFREPPTTPVEAGFGEALDPGQSDAALFDPSLVSGSVEESSSEQASEPQPETVPETLLESPVEDHPGAISTPGIALPPADPTPEQLAEVDFCLDQGMVVDAAERLQSLESHFPGHPEILSRRGRLEGVRGPGEAGGPALHDILSEDLESVLDAELERALTDEMAKSSEGTSPGVVPKPTPAHDADQVALDESGLFSDEDEFFNFAEELQSELKQESTALPNQPDMGVNGEVSLEEIFREFKKGVEQQLSPEDYETHYNLGIAYKEMALTDEAIGEFQLAAKDPLKAVECCSMLGLCFLEKGLPQLAIKWYKKGLETPGIREDDRLGLLYDLANVYSDVGDRESAYKSFLEIYGSNASFRDAGERLKELSPA